MIANHIKGCTTCRKLRSAPIEQKMADLPQDRLEPAPPISYSDVDYFGPWYVKEGRRMLKRYGVLFTCLNSRAIHIETAKTMDLNSFLNAYRRFVCRRGQVRQLRSDNGSNFVGARNELQKAFAEMDERIQQELLKDNCDWINFRMNPPYASHMGGVWERQIRTVRGVLSGILDQHGSQLDDESLIKNLYNRSQSYCQQPAANCYQQCQFSLYGTTDTKSFVNLEIKGDSTPPGYISRCRCLFPSSLAQSSIPF